MIIIRDKKISKVIINKIKMYMKLYEEIIKEERIIRRINIIFIIGIGWKINKEINRIIKNKRNKNGGEIIDKDIITSNKK